MFLIITFSFRSYTHFVSSISWRMLSLCLHLTFAMSKLHLQSLLDFCFLVCHLWLCAGTRTSLDIFLCILPDKFFFPCHCFGLLCSCLEVCYCSIYSLFEVIQAARLKEHHCRLLEVYDFFFFFASKPYLPRRSRHFLLYPWPFLVSLDLARCTLSCCVQFGYVSFVFCFVLWWCPQTMQWHW